MYFVVEAVAEPLIRCFTMRALVLDRLVSLRTNYAAPTPRPDEVLVRVVCAGICETDLQLVKGYMGFRGVLGHEFVGVAESGPFEGRRVVGEINCSCGLCEMCRRGLSTHCSNRTVLGILNHDGAFADLIAVPQQNLHAVPDSVPDEIAVFTEPVAAAFQIPVQLTIKPEDRIVVLGDGWATSVRRCSQVYRRMSSLLGNIPRSSHCFRRTESLQHSSTVLRVNAWRTLWWTVQGRNRGYPRRSSLCVRAARLC
jgi:alcohol dehydrogenase-like protein